MLPKVPRETLLDLCRRMFIIRHFEESLVPLHEKGVFAGHYHLYIGQEATGVPALACLQADDYLFTTHRNHGHLLARGADPKRLCAEILGRSDGYNKGKGGSFHTVVPSLGFLHTSAVVAGIIPLAIGTAYASKALKNGRVTVCLFGDGALEEGAAPESLNLASLRKLPVLFLCENNGKYGAGRAAGAAQSPSMAVYPLTDLPRAYKIPTQQVDGADAGAVHALVSETVEKIRRGDGPSFIEAQTVRWPGSETNWPSVLQPTHSALAWDVSVVPEKVREWYRACDPVLIFVRELIEAKQATREEIAEIESKVKAEIAAAVNSAVASPYPPPEDAAKDYFA
ncbi:MAG TPA: thiamine pyrophosphate-dependent dehydrogenase E1 component subunit alpha [Candidatus Binatia bacterium]|nr:thiamine pyrophosphate-dependent dehydrogenase E1 component subunit alpha [Candidatus Binatia bacterium]